MRYHKGSFYILRIDDTVQLMTGWIDETNSYGFYQLKRKAKTSGNQYAWKWIATDLRSGLRITEAKTRAKCSEWIEEHLADIEVQIRKPKYREYVIEKEWRIAYGKIYKDLAG